MSKLGSWSVSADTNTAASPDGFPEGMAPSGVNDAAREMMARIKEYANTAEWFDHAFTPTYVSANAFTVAGNQTGILQVGRALKLNDASGTAQPIYRYINSVSFTVVTTIQLASGTAITSSLTSFSVAALSPTNRSQPRTPYLALQAGTPFTLSATTATQIPTTVLLDNEGWYSSATGRYTPQLPGIYGVGLRAELVGLSGNVKTQVNIHKNGVGGTNVAAVVLEASIGDVRTGFGFSRLNGTTDFLVMDGYTGGAGAGALASNMPIWVSYIGPA